MRHFVAVEDESTVGIWAVNHVPLGRRQICKRLGDFDQQQNHYFPQQSPKKYFPKNPETKNDTLRVLGGSSHES